MYWLCISLFVDHLKFLPVNNEFYVSAFGNNLFWSNSLLKRNACQWPYAFLCFIAIQLYWPEKRGILFVILLQALKSESWRSKVDKLLISVATNAMEERWLNEDNRSCHPDEPVSIREDLQLAALEALLASLLSQSDCPPYLAKSLELFKRGNLNGDLFFYLFVIFSPSPYLLLNIVPGYSKCAV